jgi:glycosyltransferase involved in cell wall biosynthesis
MTPISAVIITYNEEKNIGRCLDSLKGVADEVIVVDSFSTDKTEEICVEAGAQMYWNAFEGYAQQKSWAIEKATHNYILSLDADEVLSDCLRDAILQVKKDMKADAYDLKRLTDYCGTWVRHCGWYPDVKTRLFDKRKARWAGPEVHEHLELEKGALKFRLKGNLLHYSFHSIDQHIATVNKFSGLKAEALGRKGKKASVFKMIVKPPLKFFKIYILKAGFLDGFAGFCIAVNSAHGDFLKYAKLKHLNRGDT